MSFKKNITFAIDFRKGKLKDMKRVFVVVMFVLFAFQSFAQREGDVYIGADVGYVTNQKNIVYGARATYAITDPFEVGASFMMNPAITAENPDGSKSDVKWYTANFDLTYYLLMQRSWAIGPTLGAQYYIQDVNDENSTYSDTFKGFGFNVGCRLRADISESVKLSGGWHYTASGDDASHHTFYVGIGYCFNVF